MTDQNQPVSQNQGGQVQVKVSDEVLKGVYANAMQVMHTQHEFVLDFMNLFPPNGIVNSRVIVSPAHMKNIVAALQDNLKKYEENFSKIPNSPAPLSPTVTSSSEHSFGFDTNKAK